MTLRLYLLKLALAACVAGTVVACGEKHSATYQQIESDIRRDLSTKSTRADIEAFYERHSIDFVWDPMDDRYGGSIKLSTYTIVRLFICVDDDGTYNGHFLEERSNFFDL